MAVAGRERIRGTGRRTGTALGIAVLTVFAFGWRLGTATSTGDELVYRAAGAAYLRGDFSLNQEHPPLAKWLIAAGHALLGGSLTADRVPAAVCGALTALALFAVGRRCGGSRVGLLTAAAWSALPLAPGVVPAHLDRRATLEAPLLLFTACAVLAAQRLLDNRCESHPGSHPAPGSATGRWVLLGLAVGAATASKLTGAVVAVVVLAVLARRRDLRACLGACLAAVVAVAVFGLCYLPFGDQAPAALRYVVDFQLRHADGGAVQSVAGTLYRFPPWWSAWWFQAQYLGTAGVAVLWTLALTGATRWSRPQVRPVVLALAGFTGAVVASPLKLPQYHDVVVPPLLVLAAVGAQRVWRLHLAGRVVVILAAVPLVVTAGTHLADLARSGPDAYALAARALRSGGGPVVVWGDAAALRSLLPASVPVSTSTRPDCSVTALVVDPAVADRMSGADLSAWAGCGLSAPQHFDRLTVHRVGD